MLIRRNLQMNHDMQRRKRKILVDDFKKIAEHTGKDVSESVAFVQNIQFYQEQRRQSKWVQEIKLQKNLMI